MRRFSEEELSQYNGKGGAPAYIACNGRIYDVSSSFLWRHGDHQVLHRAGVDLTDDLKQAPHGEELLEKVPIVGILQES